MIFVTQQHNYIYYNKEINKNACLISDAEHFSFILLIII